MPSRFELERLIVALGREFARRDMQAHLRGLRVFYSALRARRRAQAALNPPPWTEDLVLDWLAIMRIPPFEHHYAVLSRSAPCPTCSGGNASGLDVVNRAVHVGGLVSECKHCGEQWLVLSD